MRRRTAPSGNSSFGRTAVRTKAINLPVVVFRGGIRL